MQQRRLYRLSPLTYSPSPTPCLFNLAPPSLLGTKEAFIYLSAISLFLDFALFGTRTSNGTLLSIGMKGKKEPSVIFPLALCIARVGKMHNAYVCGMSRWKKIREREKAQSWFVGNTRERMGRARAQQLRVCIARSLLEKLACTSSAYARRANW